MRDDLFKIKCENDGKEYLVEPSTTLLQLLAMVDSSNENRYIAAYVNNRSKSLNYKIYNNKSVKFIDSSHFEGRKVYKRTLHFMLHKAVSDLFPTGVLKIYNSLGTNCYFEIKGVESNDVNCDLIKKRLFEISKGDCIISEQKLHHEDAKKIYVESGMFDKKALVESRPSLYAAINSMDDVNGYFYGTLAPSTAAVDLFEIVASSRGFRLIFPSFDSKGITSTVEVSSSVVELYKRYNELIEMLEIENMGALNSKINNGGGKELIKIGEAFQERNFVSLADKVKEFCEKGAKVVLISGPSSSGKTTFSNRLNIQLRIFGLKPLILSMDDYFVDRCDTPRDAKGEYDFESPNAVDIDLFNSHLAKLTSGEEVDVPKYDFIEGVKKWGVNKIKISDNEILVIEGIHALNPIMTEGIDDSLKCKIYISPQSSISFDNLTTIDTTDIRLIRRIVRDAAYRNHTAQQTLRRWGSVRRGEEANILPFQKYADILFDTFIFTEFSILKKHVIPLLNAVNDTVEEYSEAVRLLELLTYVSDVEDRDIPPTSILREFIGGSSFDY